MVIVDLYKFSCKNNGEIFWFYVECDEVIIAFTSEKQARMLRMRPRQPRGPRGRFQAGQVRAEEEEGEVPARGGSAPAPRPRNRRWIVSLSRSRQPSNFSRREKTCPLPAL